MLKRKDMKRSDWHRILRREYRCGPCQFQGMNGISSVLLLQEITEPMTVHYEHGDVTIVQKGDTWLQLAFPDTYFWTTAMFDEQNRLLQIYFDITDGCCFEDASNPTFEDLYLDIVMEVDGTLHVLDRDELDEALEAGEITHAQHERAVREGERLYQYLSAHGQAFADFCHQQMMKLKS